MAKLIIVELNFSIEVSNKYGIIFLKNALVYNEFRRKKTNIGESYNTSLFSPF